MFKKGEIISNKVLVNKLGNNNQIRHFNTHKRLPINTKNSLLKKLSIYNTFEEIKINNKTFYKINEANDIKKAISDSKNLPGGEIKFLLQQLLLNVFKDQKITTYYSNSKLLKELNLLGCDYFNIISKEVALSEELQVDIRAITYFKICVSYVGNYIISRAMAELKDKKLIKATINTIVIDSNGKHKVVNKKESIDLKKAKAVALEKLNTNSIAHLIFTGRYSDYISEICKEMQLKGYNYRKIYEGYKVIRANFDNFKTYDDEVEFMLKELKNEFVHRVFKAALSIKNSFIKRNNVAFGSGFNLNYIESEEFIDDIKVLIEYFIGVDLLWVAGNGL